MNSNVNFYFNKAKKWQPELEQLRKIILDCNLPEELKWGKPCYTYQNVNIVLLHDFKEYCALLFFKGALLKDTENILTQQTENVQSARQLRFTSVNQIVKLTDIIKAYVFEAVEVEKAGLKVGLKKTNEFNIPKEFQLKLTENAILKKAFEALTPGRQRAYYLYFSAPKQAKTRELRIEKCIEQILNGKGLND